MILSAMSLIEAAHLYNRKGFSIIPCLGKKPNLARWMFYQHQRATLEKINQWNTTGILQNIGVICGNVSGGLVVVDLDGEKAIEAYAKVFWKDLDTYTVLSGSGKGMHLYYYVDELPPTTRVVGADVGNIEIRANGCYVIAPPSEHPDSHQQYIVFEPLPIKRLPHMRVEVAWVKSKIAQKHGGKLPKATGKIKNSTAYGRKALLDESSKVAQATAGTRNTVLYTAALKLGSLVTDGHLSRLDVITALIEAAASCGHLQDNGERQTLKTIESGLSNAEGNSRGRRRNA